MGAELLSFGTWGKLIVDFCGSIDHRRGIALTPFNYAWHVGKTTRDGRNKRVCHLFQFVTVCCNLRYVLKKQKEPWLPFKGVFVYQNFYKSIKISGGASVPRRERSNSWFWKMLHNLGAVNRFDLFFFLGSLSNLIKSESSREYFQMYPQSTGMKTGCSFSVPNFSFVRFAHFTAASILRCGWNCHIDESSILDSFLLLSCAQHLLL